MSNVENQLKTLRFQRGQLKAKITRFQTYLDLENFDFDDLHTRFSRLGNILDQFEEIQGQIEILSEVIEDEERVSFENLYFQLNKRVQRLLERENSINNVNRGEGSVISYSNQNVELNYLLSICRLSRVSLMNGWVSRIYSKI